MSDSRGDSGSDGSSVATLAMSSLLIGLAVVTVAFRFYIRIFTKAGLKWDDWLTFIAMIITLVTAGLLVWGMFKIPRS